MTLESIVKFKEICKKLDLDISKEKDNFEKRTFMQRIFYLLNKQGINLDVKYNFYKIGPYSLDLTDYYYALMEYSDEDVNRIYRVNLTKKEEMAIMRVKGLIHAWKKDLTFLEFVVSLLFIIKDMYIKEKDNQKIKEVLASLRSEIHEESLYQKAREVLEKEGLIEK